MGEQPPLKGRWALGVPATESTFMLWVGDFLVKPKLRGHYAEREILCQEKKEKKTSKRH
jgi:hypothetical protein